MEELGNLIDSHPEPFKLEIICWGCGAKECERERENGKLFMECPHCTEMKLMKSRFCSQECFGKSWLRHKQWHKDQKKKSVELFGSNRYDAQHFDKLSKQGPYSKLIAKAAMHNLNGEFSLARPILRQAMKLDARRPEAYFDLGFCYDVSDLAKEAVQHYEMAIERWAFVAITGIIGDDQIDNYEQYGTENWMNTVYALISYYMSENFNDWEKPTWYCQDAVLKRIVKLVKDTVYSDTDSSEHKKIQVSLFVAYSLSGIISGGIFHRSASIPDDRTSEDLIEAATCFRAACSDGDENNSMYYSHAETMSEMARFRSDNNIEFGLDDVLSSQFLPGSWVIMHGLTSTTGVLLNQKAALVYGKDETSGRIILQIDKSKKLKKLLLPHNLLEMPVKDNFLALSSTMEKSAQWTYIQAMLPRLLEALRSGSV